MRVQWRPRCSGSGCSGSGSAVLPLLRSTSTNTNRWQALRKASGVFFSPNPKTISPSSRRRIARPVKSLSLVTSAKPSKLPV